MTDTLRYRLWRQLESHGIGWIDNGKPDPHCLCGHRPTRLGASWHFHVADAILAIPGIAVVELPSFDSIEDDFGVVDNKVRHYLPSGFGAYREYRLDDARDLAAALLAAADYAERDQ